MNMQKNKNYTIKKRPKSKKTFLNHGFVQNKLSWRCLRDKMNETSDIKYNSVMTYRGEFISIMQKLAEYFIKNTTDLNYTKEDIFNLAVSESFNEMIYEALDQKTYYAELQKHKK